MEKIGEKAIVQEVTAKGIREVIPGLKEVKDKDTENLKGAISDEYQKSFDNMPEDDRIILAYIHKLAKSRIKELIEAAIRGDNKKGTLEFHQVNDALQFLIRSTGNPKYDIFRKPE